MLAREKHNRMAKNVINMHVLTTYEQMPVINKYITIWIIRFSNSSHVGEYVGWYPGFVN